MIVEPVAGNMGLVLPREGFLQGLKNVCHQNGALLIFDEVMTGFRVAPGGAQELYGITPDITALGKVIGGGLPVGAYGGRRIMELVAPLGPMYQAGTLSGNPLAMAAGKATIETLMAGDHWAHLEEIGRAINEGMRRVAGEHEIPVALTRAGTMSGMYFLESAPTNWSEVKQTDKDRFRQFFHAMLDNGVHLAPSPFEAAFISTAHDAEAIEVTIEAANRAFAAIVSARADQALSQARGGQRLRQT